MSHPTVNRRTMFRLAGAGAVIGVAGATPVLTPGAVAADPAAILGSPAGATSERTIIESLRSAVWTMEHVFNPEDHDRPWFGHDSQPDLAGRTWFYFSAAFDEAHVTGRHLLGLLEARSLGVPVDSAAIDKHRAALLFALSRTIPLPQNRVAMTAETPTRFLTHNVREGLHGLLALYEHEPRHSVDAEQRFLAAVDAINEFWTPEGGWDGAAMRAKQPDIELSEWNPPLVTGLARAIGPLVRFWQVSHQRGVDRPTVRALLDKVVAAVLPFYPENGTRRGDIGTHTHSVTCTLSGLARYATAFEDNAVLARVLAFYRLALTTLRDDVGWSIENAGDTSDRGECNNAGDILETALLLGASGHPECWVDAGKIITMHLLPVQLIDAEFLSSPRDPWDDSERAVPQRITGAWGFPAPYGHRPAGWSGVSFNLDIVGGASSSLAFAQKSVVAASEAGLTVALPFSAATDDLEVTVRRSPQAISWRLLPHRAAAVKLVLPAGTDPASVRMNGRPIDVSNDSVADLGRLGAGQPMTVTARQTSGTVHLGHPRWDIRARTRGDQVVGMDCPSGELAVFPAYPESAAEDSRELVAAWDFGSGDQDTVRALDGSGGHRIALFGGATTTDGGPGTRRQLRLSGAPAFGVVGPAPDLNFGEPGLTVACWLRSSMTGKGRVVSRGSFGWTPGYFLSVGHGGDHHIGFGLGGGSTWGAGGSIEMFTADPVLDDGGWHHIAATVDGPRGAARIYVDGVPRPLDRTGGTDGRVFGDTLRVRSSSPAIGASQLALTVGSHLGTDEFYSGDVADLRFYGRPLSAAEVRRLAR